MKTSVPTSNDRSPRVEDEIQVLLHQVRQLRASILALQHSVEKNELNKTKNLVEANEHLIVAALHNQVEAEEATEALQALSRISEFDGLTQLPNRALMHNRFTHAIATAKRHRTRLALMFIDIDHFKHINDTLGHAAGDEVLKQASSCLARSVRDVDTVCRYGGDEFLILLTDIALLSDAELVAEKVTAALAVPMKVEKDSLSVGVSIGISLYPDDGVEQEALIQYADAAMYRAKRSKSSPSQSR